MEVDMEDTVAREGRVNECRDCGGVYLDCTRTQRQVQQVNCGLGAPR